MRHVDLRSAIIGFLAASCMGLTIYQMCGPGTPRAQARPLSRAEVGAKQIQGNRAANFPRYQIAPTAGTPAANARAL